MQGKAGLDAALLPILAKHPAEQDRGKFIAGLKSPQLALVQASLQALRKLPDKANPEEVLALLTALNRLPKDKAKEVGQDLAARLEQVTGQKHGSDRKAWLVWFEKTQPALAAKLNNIDGIDVAAWKKRFLGAPEARQRRRGAATRPCSRRRTAPRVPFRRSGRWGRTPAHGVAKQASAAKICSGPSSSPAATCRSRYQTTLFETHDGKVYQGMIIYQATDGVLLQTGANRDRVRIPGDKIASRSSRCPIH